MSTSRGVIVDDRSIPILTYSGSWKNGASSGGYQEYNATTNSPLAQGANVIFPFNGTSVSVFGTLNGESPTIEYTIDNTTPTVSQISNTNGATYHNQFYSTNNLVAGAHTLQITATQLNSTAPFSWYLDYIIYTPSADPSISSLRPGESFFFDDADSTFQYSGSWSTGDGTGSDMQGTLHGALSLNSSVSLQFTGTYVDVFVRLPSSKSISTIAQVVVDGGDPFLANYPPLTDINFDSSTSASSNYRLYHNPSLPLASHVMVITPAAEQALWLDYVIAGTGLDMSNPQDSPSSPSSTSLVPSSTPSSNSSASSSLHTYVAVAGVAVATVIILILLAVGIFVFIRRKRKLPQDVLVNPSVNEMAAPTQDIRRNRLVTPYSLTFGTTTMAPVDTPEVTDRFRVGEKSPVQTGPTAVLDIAPPMRISSSSAPSTSASQAPLRHADSGRRGFTPSDSISQDLPPFYSVN